MTYADISTMDYVITNREPEEQYKNHFEEHQIRWILAN